MDIKIIMQLVMFRADVLSCVSKDMAYQYKNIFVNSDTDQYIIL